MIVLAIDPGPEFTGWACMEGTAILNNGISKNEDFLYLLRRPFAGRLYTVLAYEMIASYGMPVGKDVFDTCVWIGRYVQASYVDSMPIFRQQVKMHLCGSPRAKDANIRQEILNIYPATGGGKTPQVGTKNNPGPLYGVKSHIWSAIAVGLTAQGITRHGTVDPPSNK